MPSDSTHYYKFMAPARFDKAINVISGILRGASMDGRLDQSEYALIRNWLNENFEFRNNHPFNELYPIFEAKLEDGYLDPDEIADLLWVCDKLRSTEYFDQTTADIQQLHGILGGIIADRTITVSELEGLSGWIANHDHLKGCWPYDEVDSLLTSILADKIVDETEHSLFLQFCSNFLELPLNRSIRNPMALEDCNIRGICAICPEIVFLNSIFCFTGTSGKFKRKDLSGLVEILHGSCSERVTQETNYLVIGSNSNPCWAYACYGRKVEQAVKLRKEGYKLALIHEHDFLDAVRGEPTGETILQKLK
jgi:hypothetical protein